MILLKLMNSFYHGYLGGEERMRNSWGLTDTGLFGSKPGYPGIITINIVLSGINNPMIVTINISRF